jgi:hypothetical protein
MTTKLPVNPFCTLPIEKSDKPPSVHETGRQRKYSAKPGRNGGGTGFCSLGLAESRFTEWTRANFTECQGIGLDIRNLTWRQSQIMSAKPCVIFLLSYDTYRG